MSWVSWLLELLTAIVLVSAQENNTEYDYDPILQYRPDFACSLPVQILLTGIILTLTAVLCIHLLFTAQYHWALAPVNYVLQMAGVITLIINLIATLNVVLSSTLEESKQWPYMLSYIAVNVPPWDLDYVQTVGWSLAERTTWLIMNATTSALIQITHIQFLTLLYPSKLEGRLIFISLGPLAITASLVQLIPIQSNTTINTVASDIRNVCNATLSLIFTAAVFIWGLLVNRTQAWRIDGGTAAFGGGALILALCSTGLNFLYVPRAEEYVWLPGLIWAVILWQSFLGWWWWVGAGSGTGIGFGGSDEEQREKRRARAAKKSASTSENGRNIAWRFLPPSVSRWYVSLRHAHHVAARRQTQERVARIRNSERERRERRAREEEEQERTDPTEAVTASSSGSWWPPQARLWRWRLRDSTMY